MRVSTDPKDPGYRLFKEAEAGGWAWEAELDGVRMKEVVTADEAEGLVIVYRMDVSGQPVVNHQTSEIYRNILRGHVRIFRKFRQMI